MTFILPRVVLIALGALALFATSPLKADPSLRVLTVSGQGEVKSAPDEALLSAGVVTTARTADAALAANTRAMTAVFDTLKKAGVADKDMQTSGFSVQPQYTAASASSSGQQRITGYQVSNNVSVTVEDLGRLGATLDALVSSGANAVGDIDFAIKHPAALLAQAREAAVADAVAKAQVLAKAAGVTLGAIISISEDGSAQSRPMGMLALAGKADNAVPIAAGQQSVSANVSISWDIS
jgi:uncharacterized protein YggE